jgi:hypothetical protein
MEHFGLPNSSCAHIALVNEYDDGFSPGHSERSEESHNLSSRDPSPATAGSVTDRRGYAQTPFRGGMTDLTNTDSVTDMIDSYNT